MINRTWGEELKQAIRSRDELLAELQLLELPEFDTERTNFPLLVPRPYLARIKQGDARDPLLLQILSQAAELDTPDGFTKDPLEESQHNPAPGIVHKYASRVLFILSGQCAINCRYCFRRHFPYAEQRRSRKEWIEALKYIATRPEINEVILSGGDPLIVSDDAIDFLYEHLEQIPHLKRVRIHTRLPLVIPTRVTPALCRTFKRSRLRTSLVWHINHPAEIDEQVHQAAAALRGTVEQFNQSVLLKGVNDDANTLAQLSETLHDSYIQPYYLHLLDRVQGAAHFLVSDDEAMKIYRDLAAYIPGFLLPKLAREESGKAYKTTYGNGNL